MKKKALIITGRLAQDHEFIYPFYRLNEENYEVFTAVKEKKIVGFVEVVKEHYPDPTDQTRRFVVVDVMAKLTLSNPVTLEDIKNTYNNIKNSLWKNFVNSREDVVGLDGSIISKASIWKASGHVDSFADVTLRCNKCKKIFRGFFSFSRA